MILLCDALTQFAIHIIVTPITVFETYGFQPRSCGLIYRMPARETVAGVAVFRCEISNRSLIDIVSGMRSFEASVSTYI